MKIRIYPTRNPDTGQTVFRWVITFAGQWAAGGYCATREDASKRTCLWLQGLPLLRPTLCVSGRIVTRPDGRTVERWANQTDSGQNRLPPSPDRWRLRSRTYPGIASAMAQQWAHIILSATYPNP